MRNIRDVLRLRLQAGLSFRQIKSSTNVSVGACQKLIAKAQTLGLTWPLPEDLDDAKLASLFYPAADTAPGRCHIPDWPALHLELKRKGVTKLLLWEEYTQCYPNRCYSYSQFCDRYRHWRGLQKRSMRQVHKAGEKCFVDYAGSTIPVVNAATGEVRDCQVFVATLGASNYTYAEATHTQSLPDWLGSHVRALNFFGGCPAIIVPDNLRSGVSKACRYDPDLNPSYQQLAAHYAIAVIPARPHRPKDKSKVEVAVQVVTRWIIARLRHYTFFSLAEVNQCITVLLEALNQKPFKQLPGNRLQAFRSIDQPALKPLPAHAYRFVDIKHVKVNIDYHVQYKRHLYSVPHALVGEKLELHASDTLVTLFYHNKPVCSHVYRRDPGTSTLPEHMPTRHQKHHQWTPARLTSWARDIGPDALQWVDTQLKTRAHPEQAYRVCLGLLNLSRDVPAQRIDKACRIANRQRLTRLKHIKSILSSNRDQLPEQIVLDTKLIQDHENIRGSKNFH